MLYRWYIAGHSTSRVMKESYQRGNKSSLQMRTPNSQVVGNT